MIVSDRLVAFCRRNAELIRLVRNWREAIAARGTHNALHCLRLRNGVVLEGPSTLDLAFLFHEIWIRRVYSPPGCEIHPGDVVVDVGANVGVFATYAASRSPDVRVFAYEPYPECADWLQRNVERSRLLNVQICRQAVGTAGARRLQINSKNWLVHRLTDDGDSGEGLSVSCVSLADVLHAHGLEICDLLKLDCEGSEYEILRGCPPETLARVRRIVGEYHDLNVTTECGDALRRLLERNHFQIDLFQPTADGGGIFCASNARFLSPFKKSGE